MWNPQDSLTASQLQVKKDSIPDLQTSIIQDHSIGLSIQDDIQKLVLGLDNSEMDMENSYVP